MLDRPCPVMIAAELIGGRWRAVIITCLLDGPKRNSDLKRITSISNKMLAANLHALEDSGLISRKVFPEVPPRVEYNLTDEGRELMPLLEQLKRFGDKVLEKRRNVGAPTGSVATGCT